ncbi:cytochrome b [Methylophilus sp.]|uniref:cytochrome b n=1 Tax=Methylophilus sp. TaxID=29541 RepID=UPI004035B723
MGIDLKNSKTQYGLIARILHWSSVAMLLTIIVVASQFSDQAPGPEKLALISSHSSIGILLFMLMAARLTWRNLNANPIHSYSIHNWQKLLAISLHRTIYVIIIAQCCLGILLLLTSGETFHFFDVFELPALLATAHPMHATVLGLHYLVSVMIYPLFAIHITAAIYHQIFGLVEENPS